MAPQDPGREAFLRDAAHLYDEMVSRAGPAFGETFDDIEKQAEAAGRTLRRRLLAQRLAAEEAKLPVVIRCPRCGQPMRRPKMPAVRTLDTFSGPVPYARHHALCDRCGISFSPAGPPARHPRPRRVGPPRTHGL
jgi:rubredoxin